jgi:hypothetical protein
MRRRRRKRPIRLALEAIRLARSHKNPEIGVVVIIQIAKTAASTTFTSGNHDVEGKHKLLGREMTIADLLTLIPVCRWTMVARNCWRV